MLYVGIAALALGTLLSSVLGWRRGKRALPAENTFVSRQVTAEVYLPQWQRYHAPRPRPFCKDSQ